MKHGILDTRHEVMEMSILNFFSTLLQGISLQLCQIRPIAKPDLFLSEIQTV